MKLIRKCVTTVGCILLFFQTAAAETMTDRERDELIGAVHTVVIESAQLVEQSGKWQEESRARVQTSVYDVQGNLTEKISYHSDGTFAMKAVRAYDATGKLAKETLYNADDSLWRTSVYRYAANGNLSEVLHYAADGSLFFQDVYTYDAQGHLAGLSSSEPDGTPLRKILYSYGPWGKVTEKNVYDANDPAPTARNTYTYDAANNLTEVATYGRTGALASRWTCAYDAQGNQVEWAEYQPDGSISNKQAYSYEFDATGNWTKKRMSELVTDGDKSFMEPSEVSYRTITYHTDEKAAQ